MNTDYVLLDVAKKLAAVGYKGMAPQMVWTPYLSQYGAVHHVLSYLAVQLGPNEYAAPSHLAALDWLEQEKGYKWERTQPLGWIAYVPGSYFIPDLQDASPDDLILAICDKLLEENNGH